MMTTGQNLINNALIAIGLLEQGGSPSVSDSFDALTELNDMWQSWSIDEGVIYAKTHERFPLTAGLSQYTIGPSPSPNGATPNFKVPTIPARIYSIWYINVVGGAISTSSLGDGGSGYAVNDTVNVIGGSGSTAVLTVNTVGGAGNVLTYTVTSAGTGYQPAYGYITLANGSSTGSGFTVNILSATAQGQTRHQLNIVNADRYYSHSDLSASGLTPDECYPDYLPDDDGFARLYLWPSLSSTATGYSLELDIAANFKTWDLTTTYNVPPAYGDAIKYALAFRLIPRFGVAVVPSVVQMIQALAEKAELRMREANKFNRQLMPGKELLAPAVTPATPAAAQGNTQ